MDDESDEIEDDLDDDEDEEDDAVICGGCGEGDERNYTFDCDRCGNEICPYCSDDHQHCRDCEWDAKFEDDEEDDEEDEEEDEDEDLDEGEDE
jgi:hypothetical protein